MTLTSTSKVSISDRFGPDLDYNIGINAKMTETMVTQHQGGADMRMRHMRYEIGVPTKLLLPKEGDRINAHGATHRHGPRRPGDR